MKKWRKVEKERKKHEFYPSLSLLLDDELFQKLWRVLNRVDVVLVRQYLLLLLFGVDLVVLDSPARDDADARNQQDGTDAPHM